MIAVRPTDPRVIVFHLCKVENAIKLKQRLRKLRKTRNKNEKGESIAIIILPYYPSTVVNLSLASSMVDPLPNQMTPCVVIGAIYKVERPCSMSYGQGVFEVATSFQDERAQPGREGGERLRGQGSGTGQRRDMGGFSRLFRAEEARRKGNR